MRKSMLLVLQALGDTGDGGEDGAEDEGDDDDPVDVDAHQPGGVGVLGDRLHAAAEPGAVDEVPEEGGADDQGADGEDRGPLDGQPADLQRRAGDDLDGRERQLALGARVEQPDRLLEEDRDADGGDERCQPWRVPQRAVGEPLHDHRDGDRGDDRAEHHDRQHPEGQGALEERAPGGEGPEGADHEDLAVGEVDQLDDAVDHRVADRDQRVQRPEGQPVDQLLEELVHAAITERSPDWGAEPSQEFLTGRYRPSALAHSIPLPRIARPRDCAPPDSTRAGLSTSPPSCLSSLVLGLRCPSCRRPTCPRRPCRRSGPWSWSRRTGRTRPCR